ncbi:hypothetical protein K466DRAFT_355843 [Polyporus arcularius HHB13444]|uniref:Uncharacterized protein n=1 Tax=Polyporus arcularius HHB13444 TaxID=1314778 RepID=A0A5C3PNM9_9APHY|nr:hypothetical protein K466DRAFT_355843 [Polyporus arcularius HHB13444]
MQDVGSLDREGEGDARPVGPPRRSLTLVLVRLHPCIPSHRRNLLDTHCTTETVWEHRRYGPEGFRRLCEDRSLSAPSPCSRCLPIRPQACCLLKRMRSEPCTLLLTQSGADSCWELPPCSQWEYYSCSWQARRPAQSGAESTMTQGDAGRLIQRHSVSAVEAPFFMQYFPALVAMHLRAPYDGKGQRSKHRH